MTRRVMIQAPRLALVPLEPAAASDLLDGGDGGLDALRGWPHADSLGAVRAAMANGDEDALPWLMVVCSGDERGVVGDLGWKGTPGAGGDVEIGYGVAEPYRGRGYATEAVGAFARWLESQDDVQRIWAEVLVDNGPSRAVVERLGFSIDRVESPYAWYVRTAAD